uniref:Uncharacterized protein n=1 Tax=Aegilops tauschii TaxID=37682 RepID=M8AXC9_AEGTA
MLRSATGVALRRQAPARRFSGSSGCSRTTRLLRFIEEDVLRWRGPELLFGCIALTMMVTYKYNVTGKGILGYRFDEARKEQEARERQEEARKNNIDISLC